MSSLMDGTTTSSALDPSLDRLAPPPRRFLATPVCAGDASPLINGASSISGVGPLGGLFASRGRSDGGIGLL